MILCQSYYCWTKWVLLIVFAVASDLPATRSQDLDLAPLLGGLQQFQQYASLASQLLGVGDSFLGQSLDGVQSTSSRQSDIPFLSSLTSSSGFNDGSSGRNQLFGSPLQSRPYAGKNTIDSNLLSSAYGSYGQPSSPTNSYRSQRRGIVDEVIEYFLGGGQSRSVNSSPPARRQAAFEDILSQFIGSGVSPATPLDASSGGYGSGGGGGSFLSGLIGKRRRRRSLSATDANSLLPAKPNNRAARF